MGNRGKVNDGTDAIEKRAPIEFGSDIRNRDLLQFRRRDARRTRPPDRRADRVPARDELPAKQFLPLVSERSLLQDTVLRLRGLDGAGPPIVVSNDEHRFLVAEQMREIGVQPEVQILEPVGRNTAPAVAVVALYTRSRHPDACLLVLPSDHLIREVPAFHAAIAAALPLAASG